MRFVDKLIKIFIISGSEQWIRVHIEVQRYNNRHFAERMFIYCNRIFDKYKKPITAVAIFMDYYTRFKPNKFEQNFPGTENCILSRCFCGDGRENKYGIRA